MNILPKTSFKKLHRQIVKVHSLPAAGKIEMILNLQSFIVAVKKLLTQFLCHELFLQM